MLSDSEVRCPGFFLKFFSSVSVTDFTGEGGGGGGGEDAAPKIF